MSCFIMKTEPLCKLATFISSLREMGWNYYGFYIPEELSRELSEGVRPMTAKEIYSALYNLNLRAYKGRYGGRHTEDVTEDPPPFRDITAYEPPVYGEVPDGYDGKRVVHLPQPWHYQMLKRLDCLIYQCDEDANINSPLLAGLDELSRYLCRFIVDKAVDYNAAKWGE